MKVLYVNDTLARSDNRPGKPGDVTINKEYLVAEINEEHYSIVNDIGKLGRYSKARFTITDNSPVLDLRKAFNELTGPIRAELRELRKETTVKPIRYF